jgi:hypothetical protein
MKRLIQLNLLLLLISSAAAQNAQDFRNLEKTLRVYDWKDLAQQHQLDGGEVISMDGDSVLKIENTTNNTPVVVSLLKITNSSVIKKTYWISFDMKTENVVRNFFNCYQVTCQIPPSAPGGDERTNTLSFEIPAGTSNWKWYELNLDRAQFEALPT